MSTEKDYVLIAGNSNPELAVRIAEYLKVDLISRKLNKFSDGEIQVEVQENIRQKHVYLIQSTCNPVNDNLMELLFLVDACKRASAKSITAVLPYFGYARQDKKVKPRVPISAKVVADLLYAVGVKRIIVMDVHSGQTQGFFDGPFDNLYGRPIFVEKVKELFNKDLVIVSPDAGGVERARDFAEHCGGLELVIIDKRRKKPNEVAEMRIIGDVKDREVMLYDDMVDTAGTMTEGAKALLEAGATAVYIAATHAVLSGPALQRIIDSPIKKAFFLDTIPPTKEVADCEKIKFFSARRIIGEAIDRSYTGETVNGLFV